MFSPIDIVVRVVSNYIDFWDKTCTMGKICAHSLTLLAFIGIRATVKVPEKNIIPLYEIAGLTALITHLFIATVVGSDPAFRTKKELK